MLVSKIGYFTFLLASYTIVIDIHINALLWSEL